MKILAIVPLLFCSSVVAQDLPMGAKQYGSLLKAEQIRLWPDHPKPVWLFGQVEQETCASLKSKVCWTANAKLETSREYGFSFGQFTVAYNADGSERFNTWKDIKARNSIELADWNWNNRLDPVLGLRAMVLYDYQLYRSVVKFSSNPVDSLRFSYSAYNGGLGGLLGDVKLCKNTANCDPTSWHGNGVKLGVADTSNKSRTKWHGYGQSAYDINRGYVILIEKRSTKYELLAR